MTNEEWAAEGALVLTLEVRAKILAALERGPRSIDELGKITRCGKAKTRRHVDSLIVLGQVDLVDGTVYRLRG